MTRHGSLAYYLAAWVCGCFFMPICLLGTPNFPGSASEVPLNVLLRIPFSYFLALMFGAFSSLLFGFLLRRISRWLALSRTWQWLLAGAILAPILIALIGSIFLLPHRRPMYFLLFIDYAPYSIISGGIGFVWRVIPAGAATAWVLFRIHRAFALPIDGAREN